MNKLTAKHIREAQIYLWDGTETPLRAFSKSLYCCCCLESVEKSWPSLLSEQFAQILVSMGAINRVGDPLPLLLVFHEEAQAIRFMLMELIALALEDNAL